MKNKKYEISLNLGRDHIATISGKSKEEMLRIIYRINVDYPMSLLNKPILKCNDGSRYLVIQDDGLLGIRLLNLNHP